MPHRIDTPGAPHRPDAAVSARAARKGTGVTGRPPGTQIPGQPENAARGERAAAPRRPSPGAGTGSGSGAPPPADGSRPNSRGPTRRTPIGRATTATTPQKMVSGETVVSGAATSATTVAATVPATHHMFPRFLAGSIPARPGSDGPEPAAPANDAPPKPNGHESVAAVARGSAPRGSEPGRRRASITFEAGSRPGVGTPTPAALERARSGVPLKPPATVLTLWSARPTNAASTLSASGSVPAARKEPAPATGAEAQTASSGVPRPSIVSRNPGAGTAESPQLAASTPESAGRAPLARPASPATAPQAAPTAAGAIRHPVATPPQQPVQTKTSLVATAPRPAPPAAPILPVGEPRPNVPGVHAGLRLSRDRTFAAPRSAPAGQAADGAGAGFRAAQTGASPPAPRSPDPTRPHDPAAPTAAFPAAPATKSRRTSETTARQAGPTREAETMTGATLLRRSREILGALPRGATPAVTPRIDGGPTAAPVHAPPDRSGRNSVSERGQPPTRPPAATPNLPGAGVGAEASAASAGSGRPKAPASSPAKPVEISISAPASVATPAESLAAPVEVTTLRPTDAKRAAADSAASGRASISYGAGPRGPVAASAPAVTFGDPLPTKPAVPVTAPAPDSPATAGAPVGSSPGPGATNHDPPQARAEQRRRQGLGPTAAKSDPAPDLAGLPPGPPQPVTALVSDDSLGPPPNVGSAGDEMLGPPPRLIQDGGDVVAAPLPAFPIVVPQETARRVGQQLVAALMAGDRQVELQLDPPHLGRLRLRLELAGHEVSARLLTQTAAARDLLDDQSRELARQLADHGLRLTEFQVALDTNAQGRASEQDARTAPYPPEVPATAGPRADPRAHAAPAAPNRVELGLNRIDLVA